MTCSCSCCQPGPETGGDWAIEAEDLRVDLGGQPVLQGVTLRVPRGQVVAFIGPNGAGKTTLLRCLLGLQPLGSGRIRLLGEETLGVALPRVGYVPQRLAFHPSFALSVREFLSLGCPRTRRWFWQPHARTDAQLGEIVTELGLAALLDRPMSGLSGGQLQRVLIAFALLGEPELVLFDEPTAGVDMPGERSFYELLTGVQRRRGLTVVLVSHDLSMVYRHASRVYALNGVVCCEGTPEEVLNAESLKSAFGIHVSPYHHHHHDGHPHGHPHVHPVPPIHLEGGAGGEGR